MLSLIAQLSVNSDFQNAKRTLRRVEKRAATTNVLEYAQTESAKQKVDIYIPVPKSRPGDKRRKF